MSLPVFSSVHKLLKAAHALPSRLLLEQKSPFNGALKLLVCTELIIGQYREALCCCSLKATSMAESDKAPVTWLVFGKNRVITSEERWHVIRPNARYFVAFTSVPFYAVYVTFTFYWMKQLCRHTVLVHLHGLFHLWFYKRSCWMRKEQMCIYLAWSRRQVWRTFDSAIDTCRLQVINISTWVITSSHLTLKIFGERTPIHFLRTLVFVWSQGAISLASH